MLDITVNHCEHAINQYVRSWLDNNENPMDKRDQLSLEDWIFLRTTYQFLSPFTGATKYLQGHQATLERILDTMDILQKHFENWTVSFILVRKY
jgi:hypothetical protein